MAIVFFLFCSGVYGQESIEKSAVKFQFYPTLSTYISQSITEFDTIPNDRKKELEKLVTFIQHRVKSDLPIPIVFMCFHNSRRSHMAQIWAHVASLHYDIPKVVSTSAGMEVTAFNPHAVEALKRAGFLVNKMTSGENPVYEIRFSNSLMPLSHYSKLYSHYLSYMKDFSAVMTCEDADNKCKAIDGCSARVAMYYTDPRKHDNTEIAQEEYDKTCRLISKEMLYVFSKIKK